MRRDAEHCCPCCGQAMPDSDPLQAEIVTLTSWCRANGHWISPDGRVRSEVAAEILGVVEPTLRNQRLYGANPVPYHRPGKRGRVTYALADLAARILADRHE